MRSYLEASSQANIKTSLYMVEAEIPECWFPDNVNAWSSILVDGVFGLEGDGLAVDLSKKPTNILIIISSLSSLSSLSKYD